MLVILEMMDISRLSQDSKCDDDKAGDVCKMCWTVRGCQCVLQCLLPTNKMVELPAGMPLVVKDLDSSCISCEDKVEGLQRLPCLHSVNVCEKQECRNKMAKSKVSCSECKEVFDVPEFGFPSYSFATKCSHHGRSLELYCVPCEVLVCQLCKADGIHKSHAVLPVDEELVKKNKRTLTACISEVNGVKVTLKHIA